MEKYWIFSFNLPVFQRVFSFLGCLFMSACNVISLLIKIILNYGLMSYLLLTLLRKILYIEITGYE